MHLGYKTCFDSSLDRIPRIHSRHTPLLSVSRILSLHISSGPKQTGTAFRRRSPGVGPHELGPMDAERGSCRENSGFCSVFGLAKETPVFVRGQRKPNLIIIQSNYIYSKVTSMPHLQQFCLKVSFLLNNRKKIQNQVTSRNHLNKN